MYKAVYYQATRHQRIADMMLGITEAIPTIMSAAAMLQQARPIQAKLQVYDTRQKLYESNQLYSILFTGSCLGCELRHDSM